ncbi:xanthine dehydrogenase family protein molybdopterin-binding subunit [Halioglobus pacificus]|uniref:Xanthine dehydrogenase n=1 Tax=Parahalioglobus pacificus TaxID=930806 RepID=A0A918XEF8_9GAMM|nr:molybdopterin cofactor-binding domain-containing protein [Halioglobus pacificus]GHD27128.1 xanthine dehydrogenase [Halioglobus pacificus]
MTVLEKISRRDFLKATGVSSSGLLIGAALPTTLRADVLQRPSGDALNLFVSLREDGTVEIIAHRSEMGTGIRTSLPQVVADEMEADWDRVTVIQGLASADYGSQNTDGSRSVRNFYTVMRQMGAAARSMLESSAAQRWDVPVSECRASNHRVVHSDGRSIGFGELATSAAEQPLPALDSLPLKSAADFRYIGKDVPSVDLADMTTGATTYGVDVALPGMLYASIERRPVMGTSIESFSADAAKKVRGVVAVEVIKGTDPNGFKPIEGVAVIADKTWSAIKGRQALAATWTDSAHNSHSADVYLDELMDAVSSKPGVVARERGDVDAALAAGKRVSASYRTPYLAHASMEPPMATAYVTEQGCEVWACTQTPQATQQTVAEVLGLAPEKVTVNVTLLGGGFGRKSKPDFSAEAALLSRAVGKPVQVVWTREDDIRHDYFHSCCAQHYEASIDESGAVTGWLARQATPPIDTTWDASADLMSDGSLSQTFGSIPFAIPNLRLEGHRAPAHARIGWLRSVYNIPFGFGVGSFVDELAHAADKDPAAFWIELIGEDRLLDFAPEGFEFSNYGKPLSEYPYDTARFKGVIRELTETIPWGESLPAGQGWGIAAARSFLSYVAVACKVSVEGDQLKVLEMHSVIDAGLVVNPDRVHAQMEGAMIFGLSLALMGEITFEGGEPQQSNFHDYPVARINQVPRVIRNTITASDAPPAGVGEPGVPPVAPAIANAVFAATGKRHRTLPLNKAYRV